MLHIQTLSTVLFSLDFDNVLGHCLCVWLSNWISDRRG